MSNQAADGRRTSLKALRELLGAGGSKVLNATKRKDSISRWTNFTTVSWRLDAQRDYDTHTSVVLAGESVLAKANHELASWYIPAINGLLTATSGAFIEKCVETYGSYRFGYCTSNYLNFPTKESCFHLAEDGSKVSDWVVYDSIGLDGYFMFIVVCTFLSTLSATLTWAFAPMSRGSGIPEIKTVLGGFTFPDVLAGNTLVIKILGLAMSVGAGLSCGKEGPLVHISCCWGNLLSRFFARYRTNEAKKRELLSCSCASGVAVAFGAPLGGVLFSLEEASTIFPMRTMLRAFLGASVAAVCLAWWNPTGTGKLTMFNTDYRNPPQFSEYPMIVLIGLLGGVIGAGFVHMNIEIMKFRAPGTWFRKKCHIVLEVGTIGFVTAVTSYHLLWTRVLSNAAIRAFFQDCQEMGSKVDPHEYLLDLCQQQEDGTWGPVLSMSLMWFLFISAILRYVQMTFTFGTGAAAGLFIPSLYVGAALGRILGVVVHIVNDSVPFINGHVYPGVYAMLGAAGVLGGVCRVTISLVVIMFELTGGLQLICPFMVVCMLAKWVGDYFTIGIYDYIIIVRKYPFLHEPDEVTYHNSALDVMDDGMVCLHPDGTTFANLKQFLEDKNKTGGIKYGGYPLTTSETDATLLGYIHTKPLLDYLVEKEKMVFVTPETPVYFKKYMEEGKNEVKKNALDVSQFCDETVITVVKQTPAVQLQQIFRNLGVKIILVRERGCIVGMITKKSFIMHMEMLHGRWSGDDAAKTGASGHGHGHGAQASHGAKLQEKLLEKPA